jgi:hypothetical protein
LHVSRLVGCGGAMGLKICTGDALGWPRKQLKYWDTLLTECQCTGHGGFEVDLDQATLVGGSMVRRWGCKFVVTL